MAEAGWSHREQDASGTVETRKLRHDARPAMDAGRGSILKRIAIDQIDAHFGASALTFTAADAKGNTMTIGDLLSTSATETRARCEDCHAYLSPHVEHVCGTAILRKATKGLSLTREVETFLASLRESMDEATQAEFGDIERLMLLRSMDEVGMREYPEVVGDPSGFRACGDVLCDVCGQPYNAHPMDWRLIGYGNVPFLNILCGGRRVKL